MCGTELLHLCVCFQPHAENSVLHTIGLSLIVGLQLEGTHNVCTCVSVLGSCKDVIQVGVKSKAVVFSTISSVQSTQSNQEHATIFNSNSAATYGNQSSERRVSPEMLILCFGRYFTSVAPIKAAWKWNKEYFRQFNKCSVLCTSSKIVFVDVVLDVFEL